MEGCAEPFLAVQRVPDSKFYAQDKFDRIAYVCLRLATNQAALRPKHGGQNDASL